MSAYLKYFQLERSPFDSAERSNLVLGTRAIRGAFQQIEEGLAEDTPRICVNGAAGMGKTSLSRALPKLLSEQARVAVWSNPSLGWSSLRSSIIKQFGLGEGGLSRAALMAAQHDERRLVLVIDAAEQLEQETLDHLDILLGYRGDGDHQLVHCVLLLNLDNARAGESAIVWWLDELTTLQLEFAPLPANGIASYIHKHLKRAGRSDDAPLFSQDAALAIHRMTGGVPRTVGELCERLLSEAADRGFEQIGAHEVEAIFGEPRSNDAHETDAKDPAATSADEDREEAMSESDGSEPSTSSTTALDAYFGTRDTPGSEETPESSVLMPIPDVGGRTARWLVAAVVGVAIIAGGFLALRDVGEDEAAEFEPTSATPATAPAQAVETAEAAVTAAAVETDSNAVLDEQAPVALEDLALADAASNLPSMMDALSPSDTGIDPSTAAQPLAPEPASNDERSLVNVAQASSLQHAPVATAPGAKLRRSGVKRRLAKPDPATHTPAPAAPAPASRADVEPR